MMAMNDIIIILRKTVLSRLSLTALFFSIIITLFTMGTAVAASVTLTWDRNQEPDIAGYLIYVGTEPHTYTITKLVIDSSRTPAQRIYTIDGLEEGRIYYFAIRAVDLSGQVSGYSEEVIRDLSGEKHTISPLLSLYQIAGLEPDFAKYPVVSGDVNGDGRLDLVLFADTGVYVSLSDGTKFAQPSLWYDYLANSGYSESLSIDWQEKGWSVQGTGDINGDAYDDVVLANAQTGTLSIWFINEAGFEHELVMDQVDIAGNILYGPKDFDGNGTADLLWRDKSTGDLNCWLMDESGITGKHFMVTVQDLSVKIVNLADYDGNGTTDILWHSTEYDYFVACPTTGTDMDISQCKRLEKPADGVSSLAGSGDFNGDGNQDILWRDMENGDFYAWLMDGTSVAATEPIGSIPISDWHIFVTGDINDDGLTDIIWRHDVTGDFIPLLTH